MGWEDPLEEEMATHSSILAWRIPWTKKSGGLQSTGSQRVKHNLAHTLFQQVWPQSEMLSSFLFLPLFLSFLLSSFIPFFLLKYS